MVLLTLTVGGEAVSQCSGRYVGCFFPTCKNGSSNADGRSVERSSVPPGYLKKMTHNESLIGEKAQGALIQQVELSASQSSQTVTSAVQYNTTQPVKSCIL